MYSHASVPAAGRSALVEDPDRHDATENDPKHSANGIQVFPYTGQIRLAIADDHPLVILAVERLSGRFPNVAVMSRNANSTQLDESLSQTPCDVAIIDFYMPGGRYGEGVEMIRHLAQRYPEVHLVILSRNGDAALIRQALEAGAHAFLSKEDRLDLIYVAIVSVLANETYLGPAIRRTLARADTENHARFIRQRLTHRELDVIERYARGSNITEIARALNRSVKTISAQKCAAMRKLDLSSDAALYRFIADSGLI
jgi:two-component system capsular synthesis response regulator RcsB